MSWRSTIACSTRMPALNVRSRTLPVRTLRSLVRTKAPPLPGLTCWNSTTWNRPSSRLRLMPFLRSLVVMVAIEGPCSGEGSRGRGSRSGGHDGPLGREGEGSTTLGGDHDGVLDPHPAVFRQVD